MTKSPHTIWKEGEGEFDEKFKCIQGDCDGRGYIPYQVGEDEWSADQCQFHAEYIHPIKANNKQQTILLLESQRDHWLEVIGGMKEREENADYWLGRNQALSDLQEKIKTYYQEQIKLIKDND